MLGEGSKRDRGARTAEAAMLAEEVTRMARELIRGNNDAVAQLTGGLSAQQRIVEGYQALLTDANLKIAALQDEIGELKKAHVESRKLELDFELSRAELALKEQRVMAMLTTLRDVGGAVAMQYIGSKRAALPQTEPEGAVQQPARTVESVMADIWPRLTAETVERLKNEAGPDLVYELLMKVTEHQQATTETQQERGSHA